MIRTLGVHPDGLAIARRARRLAALGVFCGALLGRSASAQTPGTGAAEAGPMVAAPAAALPAQGSGLTVMLLTVGPSDVVWERFGHNAIWIRDPARRINVAFNWGTFDFAQPNFLTRFLTGNTLYWMVGNEAQADIERYVSENRSVWVQELNLTPAQKSSVLGFVEWNAREENKYYRYDYYLDNCSTRVRDVIDSVLGGALRRDMEGRLTGTTYRSHTRRLTAGDAAVYTGIQLALGRPADRELTAWQESFLPVQLMRHVRDVRIAGPNGELVPLVASERELFLARRPPEPSSAPSYLLQYLASGLTVGGLMVLLARSAASGRRGAAAGLGVVAGSWTLLAGLLGTIVLLAGTVTRHVFMGRNVNLAAYSPLVLLMLVLVVASVGARSESARRRWAARASRTAGLVVTLSLVGWLVALAVGQRSGELFALALPAHLGMWLAMRTLAEDGHAVGAASPST